MLNFVLMRSAFCRGVTPMRLQGPNIGLHFDDMSYYYPSDYYGHSNSNFRSLLLQLSKSLTRQELQELKSLCGAFVPIDKLETINHGFELFEALEHLDKLSVADRDFLASLLIAVNRIDLRNRLLGG